MAFTTSRPWVSFERQAVAPNESIWLHSAAVGRLASTTRRVSGKDWCSWNTWAALVSEPKLSTATSGSWVSIERSIADGRTSSSRMRRFGSSLTRWVRPIATKSSNFATTTLTEERIPESVGGIRGETNYPVPHPLPPPKITHARGRN